MNDGGFGGDGTSPPIMLGRSGDVREMWGVLVRGGVFGFLGGRRGRCFMQRFVHT